MKKRIMERTITQKLELPYLLYLPKEAQTEVKEEKWPLVIFLHGAGERGNDLELVKTHGPPKQAAAGKQFPFILIAPQCPQGETWDRNLLKLDALLEEALELYPVDPERIYLTGLSMGGFGTWHWAWTRPKAFAALAPICGGTMPLLGFPEKIARLKNVPIWVFHGTADDVVPCSLSQALVDVLEEAGSKVRFTKYEGVGHDSWTQTYNNPELYKWLLAQRNPDFSLVAE